ncbi:MULTISPECIES: DUF1501 domain-containing protein [Reichenbachiella]|uniref:Tat (Twin-arginine translocation) pathway signal sequence n=2 Tax=Reichenbachiella TaxID=156993 RepID=A0A1M6UKX6_REIAG|nr:MULTISPECIES: DUF1501 domain-containing protein [Reichenbachiella]MBU2912681.1 DUF1501 domain-containing protein [Reichenbachiella agariperforans]PIB35629.1 sulfatase [Reichenbachiella sp. 5M10]RJE72473.1 sulfatase [Reichenbachiella sp. MSK19-1]UXP31003.1 DUF1501 domain-containing protein [Reichenbachiella agarivorans]SHK69819.1 Protein of unknown function [Reichenbachiella agariperforans]
MCDHKPIRSNNKDLQKVERKMDRRNFLTKTSMGLGAAALGSLLGAERLFANATSPTFDGGLGDLPHFFPKAKRVVYLFQSGGPSQFETFDYKPKLVDMFGKELPASVRQGQRLTAMSAQQSSLPIAPSAYKFDQYGESRAWVSELMPHTAEVVDDLCFIKSMYTEQINHDPAITFFQTGHQLPGRPSIGSWMSYGLGSDNKNLPSFIVLVSKNSGGQPLYSRLWGNGFLPTEHQGVQFRSGKDPVLYLTNPENYDQQDRGEMLKYLKELNEVQHSAYADPEISARIAQYEMAFRMQTSVPEVTDMSDEPDHIFEMYGKDSRDPGTYAANCLMARRLLEKDVKFVQLYHRGWDQHLNLPGGIKHQCQTTDQATAALIKDLKQRGMLEDTLVVWGGEFGRTVYSQGQLTPNNYGRDHHPKCFTMWMAGAGVKAGYTHGETDDFSYNVVKDPVHVHDFHATMMHLMGVDHERLTYKHQGRRFRLTDVHGHVVKDILS